MGLVMTPCKMIYSVLTIVPQMKSSCQTFPKRMMSMLLQTLLIESHELENENQMDSQLGKANNN